MATLSEIIIANPQVTSFAELVDVVKAVAEGGERFLEPDVKPDFPDTPRNWEDVIEAAFIWGNR
jgi:hypothetical protein